MKQLFNYHTHTYRCGHAVGTDEEYVLAAIKAGYKILGFSDHSPYRDYPKKNVHMDWDEFDGYVESINYLKEKYKDVIDIKLGIESEYYPEHVEEIIELKKKLDYVILGQHFVKPDGTGSYFKKVGEDEIREYGRMVCEGLDTHLYTYLCHPDVIMNRQEEFTPACEEVAHMIGKKICEVNIPVELNVRGVTKGRFKFGDKERYFYPHKDFWNILAQYPIKVIVGIDAHDPNDLLDMDSLEKGIAELDDLNLDYVKEPIL